MNKTTREEISLLQTQVALLQSQLDDLEETNEDLRLELERANVALRNMATERENLIQTNRQFRMLSRDADLL